MDFLGLSATLSEYKIFTSNHGTDEIVAPANASPTEKPADVSFRSNLIAYAIINGKKTVICQLFDPLKSSDLYGWIAQVIVYVFYT